MRFSLSLLFVGEKGVFVLHGDKLSGAFEVFQSRSKNVHGGIRLGFALDTQVDVVLSGMDYAVPEGRSKKIGRRQEPKPSNPTVDANWFASGASMRRCGNAG